MLRIRDRSDEDALVELIGRHQRPVLAFVSRLLAPDTRDAEDIAQHVFIRLWESRARYQPNAKFTSWLYTIARNLVLNELRRRRRHPADSLDETTPDGLPRHPEPADPAPHAQPPAALRQAELEQAVTLAIAALPEPQRSALLLLRHHEMSYEDIAATLRQSLPAIKSLIYRARQTLRATLAPFLKDS